MGSDQSLKGNDIMEKTKVTQKMALGYVLENCEVPADIKEKLEKMLEQVEKKASSGSKSMTATQKANAAEANAKAYADGLAGNYDAAGSAAAAEAAAKSYADAEAAKAYAAIDALTAAEIRTAIGRTAE